MRKVWLATFKLPEQAPAGAAATETHDYGVGAFLLAASEIYNMVK